MDAHEEQHRRIARAISSAANQLVPLGFAVEEVGGEIRITSPDGLSNWLGVATVFRIADEAMTIEDVRSSAGSLLNSLQDVVCETIRDVWPAAEGRRHGTCPTWGVEMVGSTRLWYEYDGRPVTAIGEARLEL
jgi:hypothetical protein